MLPVNETVSTYSDMAFATAVATYLAAMVLYFGEFAYGRSRNAVGSRAFVAVVLDLDHVSAAIISTGGLVLAGITSILFLLRTRHESNPLTLARFGARLPSSHTLDRMAYRVTVLIMPVWTFALMAGAIWAEAAWGRFWGWDPKETCGFIAWVVYACYLHARATAGWRGRARGLDQHPGPGGHAVQPLLRQHRHHRPALLRRNLT